MDESKREDLAKKSWKIEEYHRGIKQFCDVEKCQAKKEESQKAHIMFSLRAFLRLELQRIKTGISCFVSALTMTDFGDLELIRCSNQEDMMDPPLGILSLAAVLYEKGIISQVVNLNKLFFDFLKSNEDEKLSYLLTFIVKQIESLSFDILALSTICSSYPLTLRIAQEVKKFNPSVKIILGGPQASVVDISTMKAFPFVDFIVRGEAEDTLPLLLEALSNTGLSPELETIMGITFRKGTEIIRNPNAHPILDLDNLPLPAYYLDPSIKKFRWRLGVVAHLIAHSARQVSSSIENFVSNLLKR